MEWHRIDSAADMGVPILVGQVGAADRRPRRMGLGQAEGLGGCRSAENRLAQRCGPRAAARDSLSLSLDHAPAYCSGARDRTGPRRVGAAVAVLDLSLIHISE